ncbi:MAG: hypothetical protein V2I33_22750 [Kangiellaceae bacterium]|jgi:hypothetical protein|nr:hypothetical protein [Kangiellaceae bacterium]
MASTLAFDVVILGSEVGVLPVVLGVVVEKSFTLQVELFLSALRFLLQVSSYKECVVPDDFDKGLLMVLLIQLP